MLKARLFLGRKLYLNPFVNDLKHMESRITPHLSLSLLELLSQVPQSWDLIHPASTCSVTVGVYQYQMECTPHTELCHVYYLDKYTLYLRSLISGVPNSSRTPSLHWSIHLRKLQIGILRLKTSRTSFHWKAVKFLGHLPMKWQMPS